MNMSMAVLCAASGNSNPSITMTATYDISCCPSILLRSLLLYSTGPSWTGHSSGGERVMVSWRCHCYELASGRCTSLRCWPITCRYQWPTTSQPSSSQWQWQSLLPGSSVRSQPSEMSCLQLLTGVCSWGLLLLHALHGHGGDVTGGYAWHDSKLVALPIAIAVSASLIALWLAFHLRTQTTTPSGCVRKR